MMRRLVLLAALLLTACGGGGGSSTGALSSTSSSSTGGETGTTGTGTTGTSPTLAANATAIVVDQGPAGLDVGPGGYIQANFPYVTVTVCAPGSTTNCQVIDHVQVDTGSIGLRILAPVLTPSLLAALPTESDTQGNPVGECYGFVDSYMFGSVRTADVSVGGEKVAGMPFQAVGDTGQFAAVPSKCSSGAGQDLNTVQIAGENGVLGVGVTGTDCGSLCETPGDYAAAIYYDCPSSGCGAIITRNSSTTAPFQQLPNFAAALPVDNNGVIMSLPTAPAGGAASLSGVLYFGIGTETNNALGSATVLTTTTSESPLGAGFINTAFLGETLSESYIDSGTNLLLFVDSAIPGCSGDDAGYYCPASEVTVNPTLEGLNGAAEAVALTVANADTLLATDYPVLPGLAGNPDTFPGGGLGALSNTFAFGLPFFFGRNVYFGIEGASAGTVSGPFFAF
jgi:hypothetical protein